MLTLFDLFLFLVFNYSYLDFCFRAKALHPSTPAGVCAAISMARTIQEPLAELCNLWTSADSNGLFGAEAFYLDLHPLKHLLRGNKTQLLTLLQQNLMDAVCEVGVDINLAISHAHLSPMLAFIAGLGLRKADALQSEVKRKCSSITSRRELLDKKILGRNVYTNCIGFIRVRDENNEGTCIRTVYFTTFMLLTNVYIE